MPTLTIQLRGYGIHAGIGKIKKSTFNFWKNRNDVVEASDPNSSFDFEAIGIKKNEKILFLDDFWDYTSNVSFSGIKLFTESNIYLSISDQHCNTILETDLEQLQAERKAIDEFADFAESLDEFYIRSYSPEESDLPTGEYFYWSREGRGLWFTSTIDISEDENFEIDKLEFKSADFEGHEFLVQVHYNGGSLANENYSIDWSDPKIDFVTSNNPKGFATGWKYELY